MKQLKLTVHLMILVIALIALNLLQYNLARQLSGVLFIILLQSFAYRARLIVKP